MGSYMIWKIMFESRSARVWFEKKFKKMFEIRLIHDHQEEGEFYYDAGYLGYAEAQEIVKECKKNGVTSFEELHLCDTEDFKEVEEE